MKKRGPGFVKWAYLLCQSPSGGAKHCQECASLAPEGALGCSALAAGGVDGAPRPSAVIALSLFGCGIRSVRPCLFASLAARCTTLALQRNELEDLLGDMGALVSLWLFGNRLRRLPAAVGRLWVNDNLLGALPEELLACRALEELYAEGNPGMAVPGELGNALTFFG